MAEQNYDVIVIGAGFGGSACAGLLAKKGLEVLLVEKNAVAGGKALSLSKNGFTHTAWPVIGAPVQDNLYQVLLDELDVADLATLVVPKSQGSIYRTPGNKFVRMPDAPSEQLDPNIIFDALPDIDSFYREWLGRPLPDEKELNDTTYEVTREWGK